jgi:hypothetical protein
MSAGEFNPLRDLVVLVADADMEQAMRGFLSRTAALGIRTPAWDPFPHPMHDGGCRAGAHEFLRSFSRRYRYALVMFDREGCGADHQSRVDLEAEVEQRLEAAGWPDRAAAVVIDPELEVWL